jgi:hypothetical protein
MRVDMRMRLRLVILRIVVMLMMNIVHMPVIVDHPCMNMYVIVAFAQVQPQTGPHQDTPGDELDRERFMEEHDGNQGACKGAMEK